MKYQFIGCQIITLSLCMVFGIPFYLVLKHFNMNLYSQVLAHRGQHWTLLQNAGRGLWNCAHTALLRAFTVDQSGGDPGLLTIDMLRSLLWQPFYQTADCLLDMLVTLQEGLEKQANRVSRRKLANIERNNPSYSQLSI